MKKGAGIMLFMLIYGIPMQDLAAKTLYIEEVVKNTMGPQMTAVRKSYFAQDKILIADSSQPYKALFNLKTRRVFLISDTTKQYSETSIEEFKKLSEQGISAAYRALSDADILIRESGNRKKIGKYNCIEVNVLVPKMSMKTSMWITSDIPVSAEPYYSFSEKTGLGGQMQALVRFLRKKRAYTVESESLSVSPSGLGGSIHVELREISLMDIDERLLDVPRGYIKVGVR